MTKKIQDIPTALYRFRTDTGKILYIGVSLSPLARFANHRADKSWVQEVEIIDLVWYPNRKAALEAEKVAIKRESPKYNGGSLRGGRTRDRMEHYRAKGHVFGRRHSIMGYPVRLEAMRQFVAEGGDLLTVSPAHVLDILNGENGMDGPLRARLRKMRKIESPETFRRWRRDGFPGLNPDAEEDGQ